MENLTNKDKLRLIENHLERIKTIKDVRSNILDCLMVSNLTRKDMTFFDYLTYCKGLEIDGFVVPFEEKVQNIVSKFDKSNDKVNEWDIFYDGKFKSL